MSTDLKIERYTWDGKYQEISVEEFIEDLLTYRKDGGDLEDIQSQIQAIRKLLIWHTITKPLMNPHGAIDIHILKELIRLINNGFKYQQKDYLINGKKLMNL